MTLDFTACHYTGCCQRSSPGTFQSPPWGIGLAHTFQILFSQTSGKSLLQKDLRKLSACQSACFSPVRTWIREATSQSKETNYQVPPDTSWIFPSSAVKTIFTQNMTTFSQNPARQWDATYSGSKLNWIILNVERGTSSKALWRIWKEKEYKVQRGNCIATNQKQSSWTWFPDLTLIIV